MSPQLADDMFCVLAWSHVFKYKIQPTFPPEEIQNVFGVWLFSIGNKAVILAPKNVNKLFSKQQLPQSRRRNHVQW